jgi:hypothetical protein
LYVKQCEKKTIFILFGGQVEFEAKHKQVFKILAYFEVLYCLLVYLLAFVWIHGLSSSLGRFVGTDFCQLPCPYLLPTVVCGVNEIGQIAEGILEVFGTVHYLHILLVFLSDGFCSKGCIQFHCGRAMGLSPPPRSLSIQILFSSHACCWAMLPLQYKQTHTTHRNVRTEDPQQSPRPHVENLKWASLIGNWVHISRLRTWPSFNSALGTCVEKA